MIPLTSGLLLFAILIPIAAFVFRRALVARVLVIGTGPLVRQLLYYLNGRCITYHVEDVALSSLAQIIAERRPDRIVVGLADRRGRLPVSELLEARVRGVIVEDAVECYERLTGKIAIEALTPSVLISSRDFRKSHVDLAFGHALSLVIAAAALVVLWPLFVLIAILIRLEGPGPVLFVHDRVGLGGTRIRLLKFRTMRPAESPTSEWVKDNGDRITRVGAFLRKYRLDELPQFINVLRGELNLVGPRPHPVSNFELFSRAIPFYSLRAVVRPGLTGWAQVRQGYANSLEEETEKMRYDLYYIKHMSAWLDLRILFRTIRIVLSGRDSVSAPVPVRGQRPASIWLTRVWLARLKPEI